MHSSSILLFSCVTILFETFYHFKCEARDSIVNVTNPLIGSTGETLVSAGNRFELGFFTPQGNEEGHEYIGIWYYNMTPRTVVWVANRDTPLNDSSRVFGIAEDGILKLWYSNGGTSFNVTTDLEPSESFNRTLQLLDSGNLILLEGPSEKILWQSFDYPTDTFLPGMKMDDVMSLNSWLSTSDPALGDFVFQRHETVYRILNRSSVYWTSGEPGLPMMPSSILSVVVQMFLHSETELDQTNVQLSGNISERTISYNYTKQRPLNSRLLMNSTGKMQYYVMDDVGRWSLRWSEPHDSCSVHRMCGTFSICNNRKKSICSCLPGYEPVSKGDWTAAKYSEGCARDSTNCKTMANKMEKNKFLNLGLIEVGDGFLPFNLAQNEDKCQKECLNDCNCNAYLYTEDNSTSRETGKVATKCWISKSDLVNLKNGYEGSLRFSLSIRGPFQDINPAPAVGHTPEPPDGHEDKTRIRNVIVFFMLVAGVVLALCCCYVLYRRKAKAKENQGNIEENPGLLTYESEGRVNDLMDEKDKKGLDVPFYDFDAILSATDNFSDANKLGQGGFGPVYKGKFPGGQEIAVKRLSCCSSQGIKEFQNEVVLIAKLQHRNLVRLLGYCIKGNEKILLYEYMRNRSLDAFIFDQSNCLLLDWKKRFEIILGITRGLLYLHQDSRLRIIHRDLKTSNILLDEDMNPKISDFGLARIIEGKGTEASTNKVVGTFGYMSPEYALEGKFSTKSDVFSFGVLVLEIISGKRNTGFYQTQEVLTLLGYAWRLWSENKALELTDPKLDSCNKSQVMKCIHVGLLCVQEDPSDRPAMSNVVVMLESETSPLQPPTQPAFVVRRRHSSTSSTSSSKLDTTISNNELTISVVQGR